MEKVRGEGSSCCQFGCRPSRFVRLVGWGSGNVVQPEGSRSASSGWSFGSEAAWRVLVPPSALGWPFRWNPLGSDVREVTPGSAALPRRLVGCTVGIAIRAGGCNGNARSAERSGGGRHRSEWGG